MRSAFTLYAVLTLCIVSVASGQAAKIEDLKWMAGCWEQRNDPKKTLITEQWMKPVGDAILGMARTVRNGKVTGFEYMRIEQTVDGLVFISKPKENKEETQFKLIRSAAGELVFENSAHDFPQRGSTSLMDQTSPDALRGR